MDGEWIIPFKGRKRSGQYNQNFLWKKGSVYVMDNHRAALWCWLRHIDHNQKYNLLHIDRHSDTQYAWMDLWTQSLSDLADLTIDKYLSREHSHPDLRPTPVISWGNYLSIFFELFPQQVDYCIFATHGRGELPRCERQSKVCCHQLLDAVESISGRGKAIVNIDLDYFFGVGKAKYVIFSNEFIRHIFAAVQNKIDSQSIAVATIALSPECCGGWKSVESLFQVISDAMGLGFSLPAKSRPSRRRVSNRTSA
jgi:hypothetical protein